MLQKTWIILLAALLIGCGSASKTIAKSASEIASIAAVSKSRFEFIVDTTDGETTAKDIRGINAEANSGIQEQSNIIALVEVVHTNVTGVTDNQPWWASMLGKLATAAAIIGVAFLLWQTGIGHIIKRILYSIGWFIPTSTKREVSFDVKNLDNDNPATLRESIAAKRAGSSAYNAAWKQQRRTRS